MAVNRLLTVKDYERHANGKQETLDHPRSRFRLTWKVLGSLLYLVSLVMGTLSLTMWFAVDNIGGSSQFACLQLEGQSRLQCLDTHSRNAHKIAVFLDWASWSFPPTRDYWLMWVQVQDQYVAYQRQAVTDKLASPASNSTYKHCTQAFEYEYATVQNPEADVSGLRGIIDKYTANGYHIQSTYTMKSGSAWYVVVIFEKVTVTEVCT